MDTVDGKARLAELAKPLLNKIPPGVYHELLIGRVAETVGLSSAKLEKMLDQESSASSQSARKRSTVSPVRGGLTASGGRPSVVRRAITLLLNQPNAGSELDIEKLAGVSRPGIGLLQDLIETVQAEPNITTAGLLERWRHDEEGRHLGKLAAVEVPDEEDFDSATELAACLEQLAIAGRRERIDLLIEKQKLSSLSDDEKAELRHIT